MSLVVASALVVAATGCGGSGPAKGTRHTGKPSVGGASGAPQRPVPQRSVTAGQPPVGVNFACLAAPATAPTVYRALEGRVTWVRLALDWSAVQPAPGSYSLSALAAFGKCVAEANDAGLYVLVPFLLPPTSALTLGPS